MAFQATQALDNILLRNISFRTTANAAISSTYGLYANGMGQTYWSNTVNPANLSTLSTSLGITTIQLNSTIDGDISGVYSTIDILNSTVNGQGVLIDTLANSTVFGLLSNEQNLSNSILYLQNDFIVLSNQLSVEIADFYTSTLVFVGSTLNAISSISTFYNEIAAVQNSVNAGLSSLSTALYTQNISTYSSLTYNYTKALVSTTTDILLTIEIQNANLSSIVAYSVDVNNFSTNINNALISTTNGAIAEASTMDSYILDSVSTIYYSTVQALESTTQNNTTTISTLVDLSTNISSISYSWISSFVSTYTAGQYSNIYNDLSNLTDSVSTVSGTLADLSGSFIVLSTATDSTFSYQSTVNSTFAGEISSLQYNFSVLTTSSILAGVYETFIELEEYTVNLINSTTDAIYGIQSTAINSTFPAQNASISQFYFNYYASTMYASTLISTVIPSTQAAVSTYSYQLYISSSLFIISSLTSTGTALTNTFISTISSLTNSFIASTASVVNSSIVGYVSTPTAQALSTFSTLGYIAISTFTNQGANSLSTQFSLFSTVYTSSQSLYISSLYLFSSLSSQYTLNQSATSALLSSISTQWGQQYSTQNTVFNSSISSYNSQLSTTLTTTTSAAYSTTLIIANSTLTNIETSTTNTYNAFVASLLAQSSTIALSTLYTEQKLNITGSNFIQTMDMINYRNFYINVYGLCNGIADYRINYNSNGIAGIDYRKGIITLDISTVGVSYSNNSSQIHFNVYRWGLPTTAFGNIYPYVSNADYMLQYEYTILNQTIYTNLLNVYPRIKPLNAQLSTITPGVYIGPGPSPVLDLTQFWRGTSLIVSWSNYSFFPIGTLGAPPFNPEVQADVVVNNSTVASYFAPFTQSSIVIQAPYLTNQTSPVVATTVNTYIVGKPTEATSVTFNTLLPAFDTITVYPRAYQTGNPTNFIGGQELVAVTDRSNFPLYGLTPTVFPNNTSNFVSLSNNPLYSANNLVNGILNLAGFVGYSTSVFTASSSNTPANLQIFENTGNSGYPDFTANIANYFPNLITLSTLGSRTTFTLTNNLSTSYTFTATNISNVIGNRFRFFNSNISLGSNIFSPIPINYTLRYTYSAVNAISSFTGFTESTFIGPMIIGTPDKGNMKMSPTVTVIPDPVSTLLYYNLIGAPLSSNSTAGMLIQGGFTYFGTTYSRYFSTTNITSVQTFNV